MKKKLCTHSESFSKTICNGEYDMLIYQGKSVFGGIAIGKIKIWKKEPVTVKRTHIKDCDAEYLRFTEAKEKAISQLKKMQTIWML